MEDPEEDFIAILFLIFVAAVLIFNVGEGVATTTYQMATNEQMNIVDYSKIAETCLQDLSEEKFIFAEILDEIEDRGDKIDEICNIDILKDLYVKIKAINSDKIWEFGKPKKNKKASHLLWINIEFRQFKEIHKEEDFILESGDYKISFEKISFGIKKDVIKITFKELDTSEKLQEFEINEKEKIKDLFENIRKQEENIVKRFVLHIQENEIYVVDDFLPEGFEFREFGESTLNPFENKPVWFEIEKSSSIDMGTFYVEI